MSHRYILILSDLDMNNVESAKERLDRYIKRHQSFEARHFCAECGAKEGLQGYMVHDEVWAQAGMEDGFLHLACLEKRIGRNLEGDDFPDYPINEGILHFLKRP